MVLHGRPEFPLRAGEILEVPAIRGLDSPPERGVLVMVRRHAVVVVVVVMLLMGIVMRWRMGVVVLHHRRRRGLVPEGSCVTIVNSLRRHQFSS